MSLFSILSYKSRLKKLDLFNELMSPTQDMKILDVGAEINPGGDRTLQLIDSYLWKENITAANISEEHISLINNYHPEIDTKVADACNLPWPDNCFDIVYCNAVIEHVGDFEKQKKMASEIMRVGKHWFVTTPNRWYPFEFHLRLPFVTWLPGDAYLWCGKIVHYSHVGRKYVFGDSKDYNLRLLSFGEMKTCFSDSKIIKQRITFMPETVIAVG